jgi:hypothetical protein
MLPGTKPWYEDNPATCAGCDGKGCNFCGGEGIIPRWVVEQWAEDAS